MSSKPLESVFFLPVCYSLSLSSFFLGQPLFMSFTVSKSMLFAPVFLEMWYPNPHSVFQQGAFWVDIARRGLLQGVLLTALLFLILWYDILVLAVFARQHQWFMFILWYVTMPQSFSAATCLVVARLVFWMILISCSQLLSWRHRSHMTECASIEWP